MDYDDIISFTLDLHEYLAGWSGVPDYNDLERFVARKLDKFETKERNFN